MNPDNIPEKPSENVSPDTIEMEHIIQDLERKSEINRTIHAEYCKGYEIKSIVIVFFSMFFSICIAFFGMVKPNNVPFIPEDIGSYTALISVLGLAICFFSLSDRIFGINEKNNICKNAMSLNTIFIRDTHHFRHHVLKNMSQDEINSIFTELRSRYNMISVLCPTPLISDKQFLIAKQKYLIKRDISKKLDTIHDMDLNKYCWSRWTYNIWFILFLVAIFLLLVRIYFL